MRWATLFAGLTPIVAAASNNNAQSQTKVANATLYLAGDSTMAVGGGGNGTNGWGQWLQPYFTGLTVVNKAIGGRSSRSYYNDGRFGQIAELIKPGDIVIIEFGINDESLLNPYGNLTSKGRGVCPGFGSETCLDVYNNQTVTVYTYHHYIVEAGKNFTAKGASVVVSSRMPINVFQNGTYNYDRDVFTYYAQEAARAIGQGASFVDHGLTLAEAYKALGPSIVNSYYPMDNTHTSVAGAQLSARTYAEAVKAKWNGTTPLSPFLTSNWTSLFVASDWEQRRGC